MRLVGAPGKDAARCVQAGQTRYYLVRVWVGTGAEVCGVGEEILPRLELGCRQLFQAGQMRT